MVKKDGKTTDVLVGDETPTGSGSYAKLSNDPRVFTIASYVKSNLDKTSNDLRDKRLLTFDSDKLTRVDLRGQGAEHRIRQEQPERLADPEAQAAARGRLAGGGTDPQAEGRQDGHHGVGGGRQEGGSGVCRRHARWRVATVTDAGGTQELEVRKDDDKNYYAKSSVRGGRSTRFRTIWATGWTRTWTTFRNKKLFDFGWNDPTKVEIQTGTSRQPTRRAAINGCRAPSRWIRRRVQSLIDKLRDLSATKFWIRAAVRRRFSRPP